MPQVIDDMWRDELGRSFCGLEPEPIRDGPMHGHITGSAFDDLGAYRIAGSPQVVRRTLRAVRREPSAVFKVCLQVRGRAIVHQDDHELVITPGLLGVYDTARTYDLRLEGDWECAVFTFLPDDLQMPRRWVGGVVDRVHDASSGPGSLLDSYVRAATDLPAPAVADQRGARARFAAAGLHLLSSTLSSQATVAAEDNDGQAMKFAVMEHVRVQLRDPGLCHRSVAHAHGMSPRSLDRLFADESETVTAAIRHLRLDGARRELLDPRARHLSVGAVAARWCFLDAAHFSRAYRKHFGTTPSADRDADGVI